MFCFSICVCTFIHIPCYVKQFVACVMRWGFVNADHLIIKFKVTSNVCYIILPLEIIDVILQHYKLIIMDSILQDSTLCNEQNDAKTHGKSVKLLQNVKYKLVAKQIEHNFDSQIAHYFGNYNTCNTNNIYSFQNHNNNIVMQVQLVNLVYLSELLVNQLIVPFILPICYTHVVLPKGFWCLRSIIKNPSKII